MQAKENGAKTDISADNDTAGINFEEIFKVKRVLTRYY